jgi:hypothetical protein
MDETDPLIDGLASPPGLSAATPLFPTGFEAGSPRPDSTG